MQCDAMRCDAMRCDAMRCDAMRCDAMRCDAMRCDAMRCDAMRCDAMRCDAMRCDRPTDTGMTCICHCNSTAFYVNSCHNRNELIFVTHVRIQCATNRILTATLMPVTLLIIKPEKQSMYHWKPYKHAHIIKH